MRWQARAMCVLVVTAAAGVSAAPPTSRPALPPRHRIQGLVENAAGRGAQAFVFAFDAKTGVPYSNVSDHLFEDEGGDGFAGTYVQSGNDGRFYMPGLFPGRYRFVAQSWEGQRPGQKLDDLKGDPTLRGIAEDVDVAADGQPPYLTLRPIGTAALRVVAPHDDTFVLVSTAPLGGDPVLRFLAWKGEFLRHLVGAVNVRHGSATLHGLPAGRLYLSTIQNDPGEPFAAVDVTTVAGGTTDVKISVHSPYDGEIPVPAEVQSKRAAAGDPKAVAAVAAAVRAAVPPDTQWTAQASQGFDLPLDARIGGTADRPVTLRDYMTWTAYDDFNIEARDLAKAATRPGGR